MSTSIIIAAALATAMPDCSGPERYPAMMTMVILKNEKRLDPAALDQARTTSALIASEKVGPDLYRQVFRVTFFRKDGATVQTITVSEASREECSMREPTIYLVTPIAP